MTIPRFKLIDQQDRSKLNEGRRQGLGYGFCKRDGDTLTTIMPLSACKDYLSDIIWAEHTKKSQTYYNLPVSPKGIFEDGYGYLAATILPFFCGGFKPFRPYDEMKQDKALLVANHKAMEACMRWFEKKFGAKAETTVEPMETAGFYVVRLPKFWIENTIRISLAGWLLRISMLGFDPDDAVESLVAGADKIPSESMYKTHMIAAIKNALKGKWPVFSMETDCDPHNNGFYTCAYNQKLIS